MPHLAVGQLHIPWGGRSPRARRTSYQGAQVAVTRAGSQAARILIAYLTAGPQTDLQLAERLGLPESRISARRNGLIARRLVSYRDDVAGPHGVDNTRWELTAWGRIVAGELARAGVAHAV